MHHLDGAAGQTKGHGPEGRLPAPVGDDVEGGAVEHIVSNGGGERGKGGGGE